MAARVTTGQTAKAEAPIYKMYNFQELLSPKSSNIGLRQSHCPALVKLCLNLTIAQTALL